MVRVTYDYRTRDGFLETDSIVYKEMKLAFAFIKTLASRRDVVGKPVLERI
jgi:major membrane immunogen (membrane-anchored lipoprotein)